MNAIPREKLLMIVAGGMVIVLGVWQVVQRGVVTPLRNMDQEITDLTSDKARLEQITGGEKQLKKAWAAMVNQTIGDDPGQAMNEFRRDINQLLEDMGIRGARVSQKGEKRPADYRKGFVELPIDIGFTANYDKTIEFIDALYSRQYLVKITSLDLASKVQPASKNKRKNQPERSPAGPDLDVTIKIEALILPDDVKGITREPIDNLHARREEPLISEQQFMTLRKQNIFASYVPPPPPPPPPPTHKEPEVTQDTTPPPPPPPVNRRRDADQKRLAGVSSMHGHYTAYVIDDGRLDLPPQKYAESAEFDDGRLVFVHPSGLIVQVSEPAPRRYYFYPLGATWADREELSADDPRQLAAISEYRAARFGNQPSRAHSDDSPEERPDDATGELSGEASQPEPNCPDT
ncbi:MAG: hypothetical protein KDA32_00135 [Phycisphaerales bacterium]|nr:hypothetical protein [Phycisphaerales bacterium]